jgi:hypothetical protein
MTFLIAIFEILRGVAVKTTVFWGVTPRSLVDLYEHPAGICSRHPKVGLVAVTKFLCRNKTDNLFKVRACNELHSLTISLDLYPGGTRFKT